MNSPRNMSVSDTHSLAFSSVRKCQNQHRLLQGKNPEVNSVYLISGGFDFMVTIEGKTLREVSQFVSDKLSPLDSVLSTKTNFILKKYKDHGTVMAEQAKDERIEM